MAAAPNSSDYPNFAELCRQARDMEKNALSVPPSPLSGAIGIDDSGSIFPKEFESYTFAYMLSEAYKVERNIFASSYKPAMSSGGKAEQGAFEQKISSELHKFVSRDSQGVPAAPLFKPEQPQAPKAPAFQSPSVPNIPLPTSILPLGKPGQKQWASPTAMPSKSAQEKPGAPEMIPPPPPPEDEDGSKPPYEVEEFEKSGKPANIISKKEQERANLIPEEEEEPLPVPEEEAPLPEPADEPEEEPEGEGGEETESAPKGKAMPKPEDKEDVWDTSKKPQASAAEAEPAAAKAARPTNSPSLSSSSRISPRLRAIIEERMRRDEEREHKDKADEAAFEREVPQEPTPERADDVSLSSRERLLKKLEKSYPKRKMASEDFIESERAVAEDEHDVEEEKAIKERPEEDIWEEPKASAAAPKKKEPAAEYSGSEYEPGGKGAKSEPSGQEQEEKPPAIAPLAREGYARPSAMNKSGILIQPIFADDSGGKAEKTSQQAQAPQPSDEARLKKIQRIIDELSPDRYKAAAQAQAEAEPLSSAPKARARGTSTEINEDFKVEADPWDEASGEKAPEKPQPRPSAKKPAPAPEEEGEGQEGEPEAAQEEDKGQDSEPEQPDDDAGGAPQDEQEPEKPVSRAPAKKAPAARMAPARIIPSKKAGKQPAPAIQKKAPAQPAATGAKKAAPVPQAKQIPAKGKPQKAVQLPAPVPLPMKKAAPEKKALPYVTRDAQPQDGGSRQQQGKGAPRAIPPRQPSKQIPATGSSASQPQIPPYAKDTSAVPSSSPKHGARILPGGVAIPSAYQQTYVPPARPRALQATAQESRPMSAPQDAPAEGRKLSRVLPFRAVRQPEPEPEEKTPDELEQEKLKATTADSLRKKLQAPPPDDDEDAQEEGEGMDSEPEQREEESDSPPAPDEQDIPLPPEPESPGKTENRRQEGKPEKPKSALPPRPFEQSSREISGEAKLPEKNDDDELSIPSPSQEDKPPEPAPDDYADAKQQFKRKIEQEGLKEDIRAESEETLEQYAKENMIWLYEIYKMGGMTREDFIEKVREQSGSNRGSQPGGAHGEASTPPANPALESLNRELGKKPKK